MLLDEGQVRWSSIGRIRTRPLRRMLPDLSDQLWHCIPVSITPRLIQLLDVQGRLRLLTLHHVKQLAVCQSGFT
jgi:hypothetical protein